MNQVDNILFHHFSTLGWEKTEELSSLQDLEVSVIANLMVKCLFAINSEYDLPLSLPHNMSQRFRVAAKIAESIKDLGYAGDLGYQSILYSNEAELRRIFTFLIEKLPKDAPSLTKEPVGKNFLVQREACRKINKLLKRPWVPPHCTNVIRKYKAASSDDVAVNQFGTAHCHSFTSSWRCCHKIQSQHLADFDKKECDRRLKSNVCRLPSNQFLATLLNSRSEELGRNLSAFEEENSVEEFDSLDSNSTHKSSKHYKKLKRSDLIDVILETFSQPQEKTAKTEKATESTESMSYEACTTNKTDVEKLLKVKEEDNEKRINVLSAQISEMKSEIAQVVTSCEEKEEFLKSLQSRLNEEESLCDKEERKCEVLKKTATLTSDPDTAVIKLKSALHGSKEKEGRLLQQWLDFKRPLEAELQEAKAKLESKKSKQLKLENEISELRKQTQLLGREEKTKESLLQQLKDQKDKINKGVNRSVYTKQILDISDKVRKQKDEISKILAETRLVQKEINSLTGKLQRTFAVVEDASFKAASANERARPIYRSVVTIHEECGSLVDVIRETGVVQRETADLQQQLNSEKSKNIEDNLAKLQEDLKGLKLENSALNEKLSTRR